MMIEKKKYIKPVARTIIDLAAERPLCASNTIPVKTGEEGDQSSAESRRDAFSLWGEETEF